jgi:hypothetical protein
VDVKIIRIPHSPIRRQWNATPFFLGKLSSEMSEFGKVGAILFFIGSSWGHRWDRL